MRNYIFEISTKPIDDEDECIGEEMFYDLVGDRCEYVEELKDDEAQQVLNRLADILNGVCSVNGRELTTLNLDEFLADWKFTLVHHLDDVGCLHPDFITSVDKLQWLCEQTHKGVDDLFYLTGWSNSADDYREFVRYVRELGPDKKLYVGPRVVAMKI